LRKKLVRNKIPSIIKASGRKPIYRKANRDEVPALLYDKVIEELNEFVENPSAEEAGDIYEVLCALCHFHKISMSKVHEASDAKRLNRGNFNKNIVLEKVL
jgi:predicted house-cleaning noncanonical NTP pyrophosphatase (MazG superfamily)